MSGNCFGPFFSDSAPLRSAGESPLVFLPGWGFDGRILELAPSPLAAYVPKTSLEPLSLVADLLAFLDREGVARIRLVGWSMGAHLALDFARAHPERVASLTLLAMRQRWPENEIAAIRRDLSRDPGAFLVSFFRKCFAGDKSAYRRFVDLLEGEYLGAMDLGCLNRGLDYLAASLPQAPAGDAALRVVHGRRDLIAPVGEMAEIAGAVVEIHDYAGHAVFLAPEFSWPGIGEGAARKRAIRNRFSRAAVTYDAHADVQKEVACGLAARLPEAGVANILEIGCGSGFYTELLAARFPAARIQAVDFSPGMVAAARAKFAATPRVQFVCRDGEEYLVATEERFDLITSNATLQWFDDPVAALARMVLLLNRQGALLCSLFGPGTLAELGEGVTAVCGQPVALPPRCFPTLAGIESGLAALPVETECVETIVRRQYQSLRELLLHIKLTGTGGPPAAGRPLLTRKRFRELEQWFSTQYGGYPATYQTFFVQGRKKGA